MCKKNPSVLKTILFQSFVSIIPWTQSPSLAVFLEILIFPSFEVENGAAVTSSKDVRKTIRL